MTEIEWLRSVGLSAGFNAFHGTLWIIGAVAAGKGRRRPLPAIRTAASGNPVEVAELDTSKELAPFICAELIDRRRRIIRVPYHDDVTPSRNSNARTTFTAARDMPVDIS